MAKCWLVVCDTSRVICRGVIGLKSWFTFVGETRVALESCMTLSIDMVWSMPSSIIVKMRERTTRTRKAIAARGRCLSYVAFDIARAGDVVVADRAGRSI